MASEAAAAAINAGGSLLNTGVNIGMANSANAKAKRNARTQFMMQNYFMDKQNEYNKPVNQVKRLVEANLSTGLMYGNGGSIQASAGPSGGAQAPTFMSKEDVGLRSLMSDYMNFKEQKARIDNIESQTQRTVTQTDLDVMLYALKAGLNEAQIANMMANTRNTNIQSDISEFDRDFYGFLSNVFGASGGAAGATVKTLGGLALTRLPGRKPRLPLPSNGIKGFFNRLSTFKFKRR
ncbi:DNA pilot protein [Dipodfec virus UA06Rod_21]|uniref:DNA pilot protein n=1 Tax=Dipodfec virus UA06Rod_21 TaxID=2929321 RepID=A0A976N1J8_9VIRU|nr:DNA pilot protein [Dipodfec virus UA06Rod_21]